MDVRGVVGNQYEGVDKFGELKVIGMPFNMRDIHRNPFSHHNLQLHTSPLFQVAKCDSILADNRDARNYGESFKYQIQTLFLPKIICQKTYNQFRGVILK